MRSSLFYSFTWKQWRGPSWVRTGEDLRPGMASATSPVKPHTRCHCEKRRDGGAFRTIRPFGEGRGHGRHGSHWRGHRRDAVVLSVQRTSDGAAVPPTTTTPEDSDAPPAPAPVVLPSIDFTWSPDTVSTKHTCPTRPPSRFGYNTCPTSPVRGSSLRRPAVRNAVRMPGVQAVPGTRATPLAFQPARGRLRIRPVRWCGRPSRRTASCWTRPAAPWTRPRYSIAVEHSPHRFGTRHRPA